MKRGLKINLILVSMISFAALIGVPTAHAVSLVVSGKPVAVETAPTIVDGVVYAPIEFLDSVGAKVSIDGEPQQSVQKVSIIPAGGEASTCEALLINGAPMLPILDIAPKLGLVADWDSISRTLNIKARIDGIAFDGSELKVSTSYPVTYEVAWWQMENRLILDVHGILMPVRTSDLSIRNSTGIPIRTGMREAEQTGRIVLDMPGPIEHKINSPAKTSEISIAVSGKGFSLATAVPTQPAETPAQPLEPPAVISAIRHEAKNPERVEVNVFADKPLAYTTHLLRQPDRLVVDIPNSTLGKQFEDMVIESGFVRGIRVIQRDGRTVRITLHLTRVLGFDVKQDDSRGGLVVGLHLPKSAGGLLSEKTIIIDPGHGGKFPGTPGCLDRPESYYTLEIAKRLQKLLTDEGAVGLMTRDSDVALDSVLRNDLLKRVEYTKRHSADFFISIHCNAVAGLPVSGTETYYRRGSVSGRALAESIHSKLIKATRLPDRGVKPDPGWVVLQHDVPGVLLEVGFLDHPHDAAQIADAAFQQRVAEAVVKGLRTYVEGYPEVTSVLRTEIVEPPVEESQIAEIVVEPVVEIAPVQEPTVEIEPEPEESDPKPSDVPELAPEAPTPEITPGPRRPGRR